MGVKGEASLVGGVQGRGVTCWWCHLLVVSRVRHHLLVVCKGEASLVGGATCWWCHLLVVSRVRHHFLVVSR